MAEPLVVARGLVKAYRTPAGPVSVLQGLDLEVAVGERVAIMGASGVGKSTLLHVLGTLDRADSGTLTIAGSNAFALPEPERCAFRNRTLGFVFQFHHLLPEFTALENVSMPLLLARRPVAEAEAAAVKLLEEVGLRERAEHRPGMLSGGEQQRVAVARALAGSPRLLLADEPTGDLDAETGERLAKLLMELAQSRGLTIVLATHNAALAASCDRVLKLDRGRLEPVAPA